MKLALAQIDPTVGDFDGNAAKIIEFSRRARMQGAEVVIFSELAVCGYPPADLLEKESFLQRAEEAVEHIARETAGIAVVVGTVTSNPNPVGKRVQNSAVVLMNGRVVFSQGKMLLPYYDVFDEQRYFEPAHCQKLWPCGGEQFAITVCEDAWNDKNFWHQQLYTEDPVEQLVEAGGSVILNISASPYNRHKIELRREMLASIARRTKRPVVLVNQVGGNDSLIFDGSSVALNAQGEVIAEAASFKEDLVVFDLGQPDLDQPDLDQPVLAQPPIERSQGAELAPTELAPGEKKIAEIYQALVLGTRDYVLKCGFKKVIIGLSGGIDSALVAAIAADAVGAENVTGVGMPSEFSSRSSLVDSEALARNLGIAYEVIPIHEIAAACNLSLAPLFAGLEPGIAEENIQSRVRGTLLMAIANKFSSLVLTTGNKSEMSVGYCTLYGDMVGALAVIGDVMKTLVYELSGYVNRERELIPQSTLDKPPSAELRPGQRDTDSLPPYEILDPVLEAYVEHYRTPEEIVESTGANLELVREIVKLVERAEYKRQQAAPVLKVTRKSFGIGRRFPIAVKAQV